jgi:hypothetical protein
MGMDTGVSFEMIRGIGVRGIGQTPALGIGLVELLILDIGMGRGR